MSKLKDRARADRADNYGYQKDASEFRTQTNEKENNYFYDDFHKRIAELRTK